MSDLPHIKATDPGGQDNAVYVVEQYGFGGWRPETVFFNEGQASGFVQKRIEQTGSYSWRFITYRPDGQVPVHPTMANS